VACISAAFLSVVIGDGPNIFVESHQSIVALVETEVTMNHLCQRDSVVPLFTELVENFECLLSEDLSILEVFIHFLFPFLLRLKVHGNLNSSEPVLLTGLNFVLIEGLVRLQ